MSQQTWVTTKDKVAKALKPDEAPQAPKTYMQEEADGSQGLCSIHACGNILHTDIQTTVRNYNTYNKMREMKIEAMLKCPRTAERSEEYKLLKNELRHASGERTLNTLQNQLLDELEGLQHMRKALHDLYQGRTHWSESLAAKGCESFGNFIKHTLRTTEAVDYEVIQLAGHRCKQACKPLSITEVLQTMKTKDYTSFAANDRRTTALRQGRLIIFLLTDGGHWQTITPTSLRENICNRRKREATTQRNAKRSADHANDTDRQHRKRKTNPTALLNSITPGDNSSTTTPSAAAKPSKPTTKERVQTPSPPTPARPNANKRPMASDHAYKGSTPTRENGKTRPRASDYFYKGTLPAIQETDVQAPRRAVLTTCTRANCVCTWVICKHDQPVLVVGGECHTTTDSQKCHESAVSTEPRCRDPKCTADAKQWHADFSKEFKERSGPGAEPLTPKPMHVPKQGNLAAPLHMNLAMEPTIDGSDDQPAKPENDAVSTEDSKDKRKGTCHEMTDKGTCTQADCTFAHDINTDCLDPKEIKDGAIRFAEYLAASDTLGRVLGKRTPEAARLEAYLKNPTDDSASMKIFETMMNAQSPDKPYLIKRMRSCLALGQSQASKSPALLDRYLRALITALSRLGNSETSHSKLRNAIIHRVTDAVTQHGMLMQIEFAKLTQCDEGLKTLRDAATKGDTRQKNAINKWVNDANKDLAILPLSAEGWAQAMAAPDPETTTDTEQGHSIHSAADCKPHSPKEHARCIAFNANGLQERLQDASLSRMLRETAPDYLSISEVKRPPEKFRHYNAFIKGLMALGYQNIVANWCTLPGLQHDWGTMLVSKIPLTNIKFGVKDGSPDNEGRCITATLDGYNARTICPYVPTTHMSNNLKFKSRADYRAAFDNDLQTTVQKEQKGDEMIIVAGDLNLAPRSQDCTLTAEEQVDNPSTRPDERERHQRFRTLTGLQSAGTCLQDQAPFTWSGKQRRNHRSELVRQRIDDVLTHKRSMGPNTKGTPAIVFMRTLPKTYGSDHNPNYYVISPNGTEAPTHMQLNSGVCMTPSNTPPANGKNAKGHETGRMDNGQPKPGATTDHANNTAQCNSLQAGTFGDLRPPSATANRGSKRKRPTTIKEAVRRTIRRLEDIASKPPPRNNRTENRRQVFRACYTVAMGNANAQCNLVQLRPFGDLRHPIIQQKQRKVIRYSPHDEFGKLTEALREQACPELRLLMKGYNRTALVQTLVDTGAHLNVMRLSVLRELGIKLRRYDENGAKLEMPTLLLTDNNQMEVLGEAMAPVTLASGTEMEISFFVVRDAPIPAILGSHFLNTYNYDICAKRKLVLHINGERETEQFVNIEHPMKQALPLQTLTNIVIPANTMNMMVDVTLNPNQAHSSDQWGLVQATKTTYGALVQTGINNLKHGTFGISMTNPTNVAKEIPKGTVVAGVHTIIPEEYTIVDGAIWKDKAVVKLMQIDAKAAASADSETQWEASKHLHALNLSTDRKIPLTDEQLKIARWVCLQADDLFRQREKEISPLVKPYIIKLEKEPKQVGTRPMNPDQRKQLIEMTDAQLKKQIIEPCESPYSSPVVLIPKKGGKIRFAIDYRELNKCIAPDRYTIPDVNTSLSVLEGNKFYSALDLTDAFWSVPLAEDSRPLTAFQTPNGLYQYRYLPQGLKTASAVFCRHMDTMLGSLKWTNVLTYVDDILVFSDTFEKHVEVLHKVFTQLKLFNMTLAPHKCHILMDSVNYLGHTIDSEGVHCDADKIKAIKEMPLPQTRESLYSFLCQMRYYRCFVEGHMLKERPLREKFESKSPWKKDHEGNVIYTEAELQAIDKLKNALTSDPVLSHPNWEQEFTLHTDACKIGLGATLVQMIDGKERVIRYASRSLTKIEKNYSVWEWESLAILWATKVFRMYLAGSRHFTVVTDSKATKHVMELKSENAEGRLLRWSLAMQDYNWSIKHREGKRHADADGLSRNPLESTDPYGTGPTEIAPRTILQDTTAIQCSTAASSCHNETDTIACSPDTIIEPREPHKRRTPLCAATTRSKTRPKDTAASSIDDKDDDHDSPQTQHVNKVEHDEAITDAQQPRETEPRQPSEPAERIFFPPRDASAHTAQEWIKEQLLDDECKKMVARNKLKAKTHAKARDYFRTDSGLIARKCNRGEKALIYVPKALRKFILHRYHGLPISGHMGVQKTSNIIRGKYYWKGMGKDVERWIKSCLVCKLRKTPRNAHADPGIVTDAPHPWHTIAIDIVSPKVETAEGYTKILSIIDLFSRWVLAIPLKKANARQVSRALFKEVFCIFGKPKKIISDNGSEFLNGHVESMLKRWDIKTIFTGGYQPQANPVERYHRFLNSTMTMLCSSFPDDDWTEYLPAAVFAYNSSTCTSTGYSPYELVFSGRKTTLLHDLDLSLVEDELGLQTDHDGYSTSSQAYKQETYNRLTKMYVIARSQQEQRAKRNLEIRKAKHSKQAALIFKKDDLVTLYEPSQTVPMAGKQTAPDKWTPKFTGPYKITRVEKGRNTNRYFFWHDDKGEELGMPANRLSFYEPWTAGIISTSYSQDISRKFRCGEWVKTGSLVLVPINDEKNPFSIAKLLACDANGKLHLQWYGNDYNDLKGPYLPGWWTTKDDNGEQVVYHAASPSQIDHEPYTAEHSGLVMHQRDVLLHDFKLTNEGMITQPLQRKIASMPEFTGIIKEDDMRSEAMITQPSNKNIASIPNAKKYCPRNSMRIGG